MITQSKLLLLCGSGHNGSTILARILIDHPSIGGEISETFAFGLTQEQLWPAVLEQLALRAGEPSWLLEKTPLHLFNASRILDILPMSRCICLMRDGREVVASLLRRSFSLQAATQRWTSAAREILLLRSQFTDRTLVVRYEDLVSKPHSELERIASFLSIATAPLLNAAQSTASTSYLGHQINAFEKEGAVLSHDQVDHGHSHELRRALQASLPLGKTDSTGWSSLTAEQQRVACQNDDFSFFIRLFRYSDWGASAF